MFFAKIPRHTRQNAITEGDLECILTRNCEDTEQLHKFYKIHLPKRTCVCIIKAALLSTITKQLHRFLDESRKIML